MDEPPRITTTFRMPLPLRQRFIKRLPKRGDRTIVLNKLVEDFLDDKVLVVLRKKL